MKKPAIFLLPLIMIAPFIFAATQNDNDNIPDIPEKPGYEKGAYTASGEGNTLTVKKGEGFDFKIPEIIITGQVDTKIMMKREITSLENLQDVRSILYEKEKIYMPDYYLKEEALTPQALEMSLNRDFVGRLKLSAGSFSNLFADGIIGKAFDADNKAIFRLTHNNYSNTAVNDVDTYSNLNTGDLYYSTRYDFIRAVYRVSFDISSFGNPYPLNDFKKTLNFSEACGSADFSGAVNEYDLNGMLQYTYLGEINSGSALIFKENRTSLSFSAERDFDLDNGRKAKTIINADGYAGEQAFGGAVYSGVFDMNVLFKGIFYLEPLVFQGGLKLQDYRLTDNYFNASPYLNVNYDLFTGFSAYAEFKPEMRPPDYTALTRYGFLAATATVKPSTDSADLKAGLNLNIFDIFFDLYWGYRSVKNNIYIDENGAAGIFTLYNNDLDYDYAGINIETLKLKNFTVTAGYEYRNIISVSTAVETRLPLNSFTAEVIYEMAEWKFNVSAKLESTQWGTLSLKAPAYALVNASISRKINDLATLFFYINNILNNSYYALYYYKEKPLNLGLGISLNF